MFLFHGAGPMRNNSIDKLCYVVIQLYFCSGFSLVRILDCKCKVADIVVEIAWEL